MNSHLTAFPGSEKVCIGSYYYRTVVNEHFYDGSKDIHRFWIIVPKKEGWCLKNVVKCTFRTFFSSFLQINNKKLEVLRNNHPLKE